MDALQFTLFFIALLVGYVLLHLRLVRFEEHMQKLSGIRSIDDRLKGLDDRLRLVADAMEKLRLDRVEARLDRLHEDLEDVREATIEVQRAVVQIPVQPGSPAQSEPAPSLMPVSREAATARLVAIVESRLLQLGYSRLNLLTDLSAARLDADLEVQVECERAGMPVKGRVLLRNGSVRDVSLQSVAQMFP
jgi:hypothetical protein